MAKLPLENKILPFPRMLMQKPKAGGKLPKMISKTLPKTVKHNLPIQGKMNISKGVSAKTGKVSLPHTAPTKTGGSGVASRPHKYVKREGSPGHYKYWYKLPSGKLGTKKELEAELKQQKPGEVKQQETKQQVEVKTPTKPPKAVEQPKAKLGALQRIKDTAGKLLNKFKQFIAASKQENKPIPQDTQVTMGQVVDILQTVAVMMQEMKQTPSGQKIMSGFKFSKEKIDSMNSITDLDSLMTEAKNPEKPQPEQTVNKIQKRINFLSKLDAERQDKESQQKFQKEIQEVSDPKNKISATKIKKVSMTPSSKTKAEVNKASENYLLKLVNNNRKTPFKGINDYYAYNKKVIENALKKTSGITKGYTVDEKTGTVTFANNKLADAASKQLKKYKTVVFRDSEDPKTFKRQIVFSKLGNNSILSPMNSSYLDASQAIANKSKSGSSTAWVPLGFNGKTFDLKPSDGSENAETSSLTFAMPGVGKTINIEGSTLAALMGNPEGTYKAVIVDPASSAFSILNKDDASLDPKQKALKSKLTDYVDKGLLTILTPKNVTGQDELNDKNSQQYVEAVLDRLNKDRTLQTARRTSQNLENLASSTNVEPTTHYQIDELGKILSLNVPKNIKEKFSSSLFSGINDTARKGKMIFNAYSQTPEGLPDSIKGANWKRIQSIGKANDRSIASAFKIKGGPEMIRKTPDNGVFSIDKTTGAVQYFQKPVGGEVVLEAMAQTPVKSSGTLPKSKAAPKKVMPKIKVAKKKVLPKLTGRK